jgi:phospholipid/cholesterol/gamma-HCH transport system substrate-binding protein
MTTSKQQKIRIGMFALATGILLGVVLVVFAGLHLWQDRARYYVEVTDSVYGLEAGADVHLNGIRVGKVGDIALSPTDLGTVRVAIDIDEDTPVRTDTRAILQFAGITGLKVIDLRGGSLAAARLPPGGVIPLGETTLDRLEKRAIAMVEESTELMKRANAIVERTEQIVANMTEITDPEAMTAIIAQTRVTAHNLAQASGALRGLIDENRAGLKSSIAAIELAAKRASEVVDGNQVRAAVADLRQASRSFKELAREVRQKPSRLFFGNSAPDRKLP